MGHKLDVTALIQSCKEETGICMLGNPLEYVESEERDNVHQQ